jgi:hypothetical protein
MCHLKVLNTSPQSAHHQVKLSEGLGDERGRMDQAESGVSVARSEDYVKWITRDKRKQGDGLAGVSKFDTYLRRAARRDCSSAIT